MTDWKWFNIRYTIEPTRIFVPASVVGWPDEWSVIDNAHGHAVKENLPMLEAYREAVALNELK